MRNTRKQRQSSWKNNKEKEDGGEVDRSASGPEVTSFACLVAFIFVSLRVKAFVDSLQKLISLQCKFCMALFFYLA